MLGLPSRHLILLAERHRIKPLHRRPRSLYGVLFLRIREWTTEFHACHVLETTAKTMIEPKTVHGECGKTTRHSRVLGRYSYKDPTLPNIGSRYGQTSSYTTD